MDKREINLVKFCQAWLIGLETKGGGGFKDPMVNIKTDYCEIDENSST